MRVATKAVAFSWLIPLVTAVAQDGFTMMIASYKRNHLLPDLLTHLTTTPPPSLRQIVVIWQNIGEPLPPILLPDSLDSLYFASNSSVRVTVRMSKVNSMNERFRPALDWGEKIETHAVMIHDDDVVLRRGVLEWGYQQFLLANPIDSGIEEGKIVGFTARDFSKIDPVVEPLKAEWDWEYIVQPKDTYSMVLSNAAWFKRDWFDKYFEEEGEMVTLRNYVDEVFNCDDLLINYIVSNLTHQPPLLLQPTMPLRTIEGDGLWSHKVVETNSSSDSNDSATATAANATISPSPNNRKLDHFTQRYVCLSHFYSHFLPYTPPTYPSIHYPLVQTSTSASQIVKDRARYLNPKEEWEEPVWGDYKLVDPFVPDSNDGIEAGQEGGPPRDEDEVVNEYLDSLTEEEMEEFLKELDEMEKEAERAEEEAEKAYQEALEAEGLWEGEQIKVWDDEDDNEERAAVVEHVKDEL